MLTWRGGTGPLVDMCALPPYSLDHCQNRINANFKVSKQLQLQHQSHLGVTETNAYYKALSCHHPHSSFICSFFDPSDLCKKKCPSPSVSWEFELLGWLKMAVGHQKPLMLHFQTNEWLLCCELFDLIQQRKVMKVSQCLLFIFIPKLEKWIFSIRYYQKLHSVLFFLHTYQTHLILVRCKAN